MVVHARAMDWGNGIVEAVNESDGEKWLKDCMVGYE